MYVCTRVLPSISIDDGVFKHRSSKAFAEVLDQFGGVEHRSGTAVGLRWQKFWINFAESSVMSALERRLGQPKGVKLALEWHCGQPEGVKLDLERCFGRPDRVKLALERPRKFFQLFHSFDDPKPRPEIYG